ncbi:MAG: nucleotidyl transferase AbiEii/AbiGii toxin family protein [Candidatus Diapherotrites archaeon]
MRIPLSKRLRKRLHRELALLQDEVADIVYGISQGAVLHGGTAIWRCYQGNRFSEDLDFCLKAGKNFRQEFSRKAVSSGLELRKFRQTANTIFSAVSNGAAEVRLEIALRTVKNPVVKPYEKADGSHMDVFTLSPECLLLEKIAAYCNRKLARDFYDIYFLNTKITERNAVKKEIRALLAKGIKPVDEKNLRTLIYSGAIPSYGQMVNALQGGES